MVTLFSMFPGPTAGNGHREIARVSLPPQRKPDTQSELIGKITDDNGACRTAEISREPP